MDSESSRANAIGTIELELLKLVRHLETFGRRCSMYVRMDRAGYLAMRVLEFLGPVSTHALAQALRLDASTVTRQITALERGGFVERRPDPADGRSSSIVLTPEGLQTMHDLEQERRGRIEAVVRDWADADQADLGLTLTRLNASLLETAAELDDPRQCEDAPTADAPTADAPTADAPTADAPTVSG